MAENNLARSRNDGPDLFADDDPLAELARIVGYEHRPVANAITPPARREPASNLEDELLREFERYDTPRLAPAFDVMAESMPHSVEPVAPDVPAEVSDDLSAGGDFAVDVPSALDDRIDNFVEAVDDELSVDEADHVEPAAFDVPELPVVGPVTPAPYSPLATPLNVFDLAMELENSIGVASVAPVAEPKPEKPRGYVPGFRMPLANFNPTSATPRREPELIPEPTVEPSPQVSIAAPVKPEPLASSADDGSYRAVVQAGDVLLDADELFSSNESYVPPSPPVQAPTMVVAPVAAPASSAGVAEEDEFSDEEFEIALGDLELDLAEIVVEENRTHSRRPDMWAAPDDVPVAPVSPAPVSSFSMSPGVETEEEQDAFFDPAQFADTEEHVEAIGELDVPSLPVEEAEEHPSPRTDYEFDIDAELAALLTNSNIATASAQSAEVDLATAVPAGGDRATPAHPGNYADLDDFERALEEDFRRSLSAPLQPVNHEALRPAEADYVATFENARRSIRGWAVPAVLACIVIAGGVGAYAWLGSEGATGDGEPIVIAADTDPVKVAPANPGGRTVPNQDKAVYDRVAGVSSASPKQQTLISSSEQPVDVVQQTLMPDGLPLEGENDAEFADDADARLLPEEQAVQTAAASEPPVTVMPRRVKTMIVRPDGTLVEQEVAAPAVAAPAGPKVPAAGVKTAEIASKAPAATAPAVAAPASQASVQNSAGVVPVSAPVAPTADAQAASQTTSRTPAATAATGARAPVPVARPAEQPVNVVAAVTDQGSVRAPGQASATTNVAAVGEGGYVIQIASLPTQADAQKSYQNLSAKFGGVIGGRGVDIKAAEIAGKGTFYRVRIPAGSKTDAVALCEKYRAAGGSCIVAR